MSEKSKLTAPTQRPLGCVRSQCGKGPDDFEYEGYEVYWRCPHQQIYSSHTTVNGYNNTKSTYWKRLKGRDKRKGDRFLRQAEEHMELVRYDSLMHYGIATTSIGASMCLLEVPLWGEPRIGPWIAMLGLGTYLHFKRRLEVGRVRHDINAVTKKTILVKDMSIRKLTLENNRLQDYRHSNEDIHFYIKKERERLNNLPENPHYDEKTAVRHVLATVEMMLKPTSNHLKAAITILPKG